MCKVDNTGQDKPQLLIVLDRRILLKFKDGSFPFALLLSMCAHNTFKIAYKPNQFFYTFVKEFCFGIIPTRNLR